MSSLRVSETYFWQLFPLYAAGLFEDRPYPSPGSENGLDFLDTPSVASPYLCCFCLKGGKLFKIDQQPAPLLDQVLLVVFCPCLGAAKDSRPFATPSFHLRKKMFYVPFFLLKGIYHYWMVSFGLNKVNK